MVHSSPMSMHPICQEKLHNCRSVRGPLSQFCKLNRPHPWRLTVFAIVYNLVRMVMWHSAILQHIAVERISFLDALRWLDAPSTGMPLGGLLVNPVRPYGMEPRVKKRRPKAHNTKRLVANFMPFTSCAIYRTCC